MREDELEPEEIQDIDRRLRGLARRLVGDENHASDLVQDAWLSALTKEGGPIRRLGAWLSVAVQRGTSRTARDAQRRADVEELMGARGAAAEDATIETRDAAAALRAMIDELADPYREVVRLRYLDEVAISEIADRLERTPSTVRSQLARGVDQLRARIGDREDLRPAIVALAFPRRSTAARAAAASPSAVPALFALALLAIVTTIALRGWLHEPRTAPSTDVTLAAQDDAAEPPPAAAVPAPAAEAPDERREALPVPLSPADFASSSQVEEAVPEEFALRMKVEVLNADGTPAQKAALIFLGPTDAPTDRASHDGRFDVVLDERRLQRSGGVPVVFLRALSVTEAWSTLCTVSFRQREVSFQLKTGGQRMGIRGRVLDPAGRAVEGARVQLLPTLEKDVEVLAPGVALFEYGHEKFSTADGRFAFGALGGGIWRLVVTAEGHGGVEQPVDLTTEVQEVEISLVEPRVLTGRVRDAGGNAVAGALVWIKDHMDVDTNLHEVRSDDEGRFEIVGVGERFWLFAESSATSPAYASRAVEMEDERTAAVELVIVDRPGLRFEVRRADGEPAAEQALVLSCSHERTFWSDFVQADANGRALVRRVPSAPVDVFRDGQQFASPVQLAVDAVEREEPYALVVAAIERPSGEVTATLIDALGDPLEAVDVDLVDVDFAGPDATGSEPTSWNVEYHAGFGALHGQDLPTMRFHVEAVVAARGVATFGPFDVETGAAVDLGELVMPDTQPVHIDWAAEPPSVGSTWSLAALEVLEGRGERVIASFSGAPEGLALYPGAYRLTNDRTKVQTQFEVDADAPAVVRVEE
ncbi:MAG: sigma-70 family RNA polymerase sigma factor [Planctomycetota bacterium]